ncbi:MAG: hypothetical protein LAT77_00815 [Aliidiomarina sp.]|uniref:hypothetical protein n=1 Tax=Aliidiomarina sp. TaxID=1872439 RepID=UPI0025C1E79D|nr:hypothetical protein [Aliidiomarina sp.]MCH8500433.1 hypothetical protein [Aliidiomarina sp.]
MQRMIARISLAALFLSGCNAVVNDEGAASATWLPDSTALVIVGRIDGNQAELMRLLPESGNVTNDTGEYRMVSQSRDGIVLEYPFATQSNAKSKTEVFTVTIINDDLVSLTVYRADTQLLHVDTRERPQITEQRLQQIQVWRSDSQVCLEWPRDAFPHAALAWRENDRQRHLFFTEATDEQSCTAALGVPDAVEYVVTLRHDLFVKQALVSARERRQRSEQ